MKPSLAASSPVISLLSSSPAASRRIQSLFGTLFALKPLSLELEQRDTLDRSSLNTKWDSVASKCPSSGAIVHLVSLEGAKKTKDPAPLSLLAITGGESDAAAQEALLESRRLLALHIKEYGQGWKLSLSSALGGSISASYILGKKQFDGGLPLLKNLPSTTEAVSTNKSHAGGLKECCIPFHDDSKYNNGSTLLSELSSLYRPVVGLYKWNNLSIRPLPSATEDLSLPPPSLVFQCDSDNIKEELSKAGAECAKIGYNGTGQTGQVIVRHEDLLGLEIRLCPSDQYSSSFAEAQDALLASSLEDLQNQHVMREGKMSISQQKQAPDARLGDCWMEVRANMKQPSGFLKRTRSRRATGDRRTATAPDLPYE